MTRKLYRSVHGKMIGGVASGLADYFNVDVTFVRIAFLVSLLFGGVGLLAYVVCWISAPKSNDVVITIDDESGDVTYREARRTSVIGGIAKAIGAFVCMAFIWDNTFDSWDGFGVTIFIVGLAIGMYFLWRNGSFNIGERIGLHRSSANRRIAGVFGGLAEKWGVDATLLRIAGVVLLFAGVGLVIPVYFLYSLLVPRSESHADEPRPIVVA